MRKQWVVGMAVVLLGGAALAQAEPVSFEQAANVTGLAGIEVGANVDYAYSKVESGGVTVSEETLTDVPVFVRVGLPILEAKLTLPFGTVQDSVADESFSGIKDMGIMVKTGLLTLPVFSLALGVETTFPTGDPMKYLGEGFNFTPFAAAGIDLQMFKLHANLGYRYRSEFSVDLEGFDSSGNPIIVPGVKTKPGDAINFAAGVEVPAGDTFSLHLELLVSSYAEALQDGVTIPDSAGATFSVVPGVRLKAGPFKAKLGFEIPLENKDDRPAYAPTADWRVLGGVSLQFSI